MAKTTRLTGASQEETPVRITRAVLGGERSSVGSNLTTSSESESPTKDSGKQSRRKPAQTTGNRSKRRGKAADSDADSTAGVGQRTEQTQSDKAASTRSIAPSDSVDDDDFFE